MADPTEDDVQQAAPVRRVLVVDDATTVRMYVRQLLEADGFAVEEAVNGLEGLEKALSAPFDLLIVDVNMARMDGYRMVGKLRTEPSLMAIPVIMVSTESKDSDIEKAFAAGANYYLTKPLAPDTLHAAVRLMTGVAGS